MLKTKLFPLPLFLFSHLGLHLTVYKNFPKFLQSVILAYPPNFIHLQLATSCSKTVLSNYASANNLQVYSNIYPKRCNVTQFIYIWKLLYMFLVVPPPIIRSAYNCIYSIWYLSHRYCYLPLSWRSWN